MSTPDKLMALAHLVVQSWRCLYALPPRDRSITGALSVPGCNKLQRYLESTYAGQVQVRMRPSPPFCAAKVDFPWWD